MAEPVLVVWSETGNIDDPITYEDWGDGVTPRLTERNTTRHYFDDAVQAASFLMVNVRVEAQLSVRCAKELLPSLDFNYRAT
jgi:hypothetical protein